MGQSVTRPRPEDIKVGKPEPYMPGKDFDDWDFTFNGYAGKLDPTYETVNDSGDGNSTTRTAVRDIAVSAHDAHTETSPESRRTSSDPEWKTWKTV